MLTFFCSGGQAYLHVHNFTPKKYKKVVTYFLIFMSKCYYIQCFWGNTSTATEYSRFINIYYVLLFMVYTNICLDALTFQMAHSRIILKLKICALLHTFLTFVWLSC